MDKQEAIRILTEGFSVHNRHIFLGRGGGVVLPIMDYLGDAARKGYFFRIEVYKRVGISQAKSIGKGRESCHLGIKMAFQKILNRPNENR